jgi:restriction system protein
VARRGFFAELQHQARVAAREAEREERAAERAHKAAVRQAEQARKAEQRAQAQLARAAEADRKRLAKQAREAHIAAMGAEVERRNLELVSIYEEIDSLLAATLDVDDYVDLDALRATVDHPPFERTDLETPVAAPGPIPDMPEPVGTPPAPPKGIRALFGVRRQNISDKRARLLRDGSWFWPRPRWRPGTPSSSVAS